MGTWGKYKHYVNSLPIGSEINKSDLYIYLKRTEKKKTGRPAVHSMDKYISLFIRAEILESITLYRYIVRRHIRKDVTKELFMKAAAGDNYMSWFTDIYKD